MTVPGVLRVGDISRHTIEALLQRYELTLVLQDDEAPITGSFWGETEAGIVGSTIYVRRDTPVHSLLHETCHVVCMDEQRRSGVVRDAGGDDLEETAVCYLQVILADYLPEVGGDRLMRDMDAWGYSFRLGNTATWFAEDAEDALEFLRSHDLLTAAREATFKLRQ